jgi:nitronate monooxygenase
MVTTLHRPVCDILGCTVPIVLAGMGGVSRSELVAAVTEGGGFGFLGMVREPVKLIQAEVTALRARGIARFGVNLIPAATDPSFLDAQVSACIELGVPVVSLFWDASFKLIARLRAAGIVVVCQVGSPAEAQAVEQAGAQIIITQGVEAGGHVRGDHPLHNFVPEVVAQTELPVLAAGGLADGADLATVLALGTQGAVFGTALIATPESFAHDYHKQRLLNANGVDAVLTDAFHINWPRGAKVRVLANSVTRGEHGDPFAEVRTVIGDEAGRPIYLFSTESPLRAMTGTFEAMALYAGTGVGRITEIVGAADRVRAIADEAARLLDANATAPGRPAELASPACLAHEMDDCYMGFASREALLPALNELLEAERAGARITLASMREMIGDNQAALILSIHRDEARWCGVLTKAIRRLDGASSAKTGAFYDKAMSIPDQNERLAFLNRGQGWVVRKLKALLPTIRDPAIHADLAAMLASHERNIDRVAANLATKEYQGASS